MSHSFAVGYTPVKTFERLIAKLYKQGREYRLYGKQLSNTIRDFILRDHTGSQAGQWDNITTRELVAHLKSNGYSLKANENKLYRKVVTVESELVEHAKALRASLNEQGILHSKTNHHSTVCSTIFIDSRQLTEDLSNKRREFIQSLKSLDQFDDIDIRIGAKVAIISAQMQGDYVEVWGFTTPKTITKIARDPSDKSIKQFEFNNDPSDVWPREDNVEYSGQFLVYSAFFDSKAAASNALILLALKMPEGLNIRSHVKEHKGSTMNTNEQELMNEDHFSPDEVAAIKSCEDSRVKDFYREYVRAEAVGDMNRADMMAQLIKDRCELLGITVTPQMSEEPCGECGVPAFEAWEAKMKAAGARRFEEDSADAMVRAVKVVEGKDFVLGEFDKALDSEVFEKKADLYTEYTMEGSENDQTVWMEKVTAEGATSIKNVGYTQIAFMGESRIGRFTPVKQERKIKSFNQLINESTDKKEPLYEPLKFPTAKTSATNIVDILKLSGMKIDEAWANEPDEKVADAETQLITMSGGLNRKKKQVNPDNPADNPLTMKKPAKAGFLNIEEEELAESLEAEFKNFDSKKKSLKEFAEEVTIAESSDPYGEGYSAGYKGKSAENNPYPPQSKDNDQWDSGWRDGRDEMRHKSREESTDFSKYVGKVIAENVEYDGNIGDEVIIIGNVQFSGEVGVISDFGQDRRFVIVDLYNHGKKSFHASDVAINDQVDTDDDRDEFGFDYEDDTPEFMGRRGLDEASTGPTWQEVINALSMGAPDIDPADALMPLMRKYRVDFDYFDKLARQNGYRDVYAVMDELGSVYEDSMSPVDTNEIRWIQKNYPQAAKTGDRLLMRQARAAYAKYLRDKYKNHTANTAVDNLDETTMDKDTKYTGRETKDGVWRVFEKGNSVAVAGPFDSAAECNKWIKDKKEPVAESNDELDESSRSMFDRLGWAHNKSVGLGGPKDMRKRHREYDTDTLKKLKSTNPDDNDSPYAVQQRMVNHELKKRGEINESIDSLKKLSGLL